MGSKGEVADLKKIKCVGGLSVFDLAVLGYCRNMSEDMDHFKPMKTLRRLYTNENTNYTPIILNTAALSLTTNVS